MAILNNNQDAYYRILRSWAYNPGQKFVSAQDEADAINAAAITVASRLGGISYIDATLRTAAGVSDYAVPNNIFKVKYLEIIDTTVTPNVPYFIDVVSYEQFRAINWSEASRDQFAYFDPETNNLHIEPAPTTSSLTIKMLAWGLPNELQRGSLVLYDGDISQVNAVCKEAVANIRIKTRDVQESQILHQRAMESVEDAGIMGSVQKQTKRVRVGRNLPLTRLRRF